MAAVYESNQELAHGQPEIQVSKTFQPGRQKLLIGLALALILFVGAFLRFYELGSNSVGNSYYAATVQSMLLSWHNFFFAAFEPGGSVTVDKPPLGFWVQAASAAILGVNGFALALPQALAGVLSIPLVYWLVRRHFGDAAGLAAALALAVIPVTVSTERNNTIDGLLVFVLLLAAWAVLVAVERGKLRYLLLSGFLVGLGFEIKMLQAYMILPALVALYFLGAPHRWWKRLLHLAWATAVLLVVSLWWPIVVDLTPASERPFIGSSTDNTVMELITGHNGIRRLIGGRVAGGPDDGQAAQAPGIANRSDGQLADGQFSFQGQVDGQQLPPPGGQSGNLPPGGPSGGLPAQRPGGASEVGQAGWLRLFTEPLATEAGWLLPLALLGIPLALMALGWRWPLSGAHLEIILWAGWLLPCMLYFSLTTGLFHAYYLIMLGPPTAALAGAAVWALWRIYQRDHWMGWAVMFFLASVTLAAQAVPLLAQPQYGLGVLALAGAICLVGMALLAWKSPALVGKLALGLVVLGLGFAPLAWAGLTTLNNNPNVALPRSGPGDAQSQRSGAPFQPNASQISPSQQPLLEYLLANTDPDSYLVATLSARQASPLILATLRPVLTFGGFSGNDDVVDVTGLAQMVSTGELRFVLGGGDLERSKPEIASWLRQTCQPVSLPGRQTISLNSQPSGPGAGMQPGQEVLYDCRTY